MDRKDGPSPSTQLRREKGPLLLKGVRALAKHNPRDIKIPRWYAHMWGLPLWHLCQSGRRLKRSPRLVGLTLIVRMNYILHYAEARRSRSTQSFGLRKGSYFKLTLPRDFSGHLHASGGTLTDHLLESCGRSMSRMLRWDYPWRTVLACTIKRFVNLAPPVNWIGPLRPTSE
jgi:hypothetical protein